MRLVLLFGALFAMIVAMARPVYQKGVVEVESYVGDVVIALDISRSMKAKDYYPNRLTFAKKKIEDYIEIGVQGGSRRIMDGRNPEVPERIRNGYYVGPTIFADVTPCRTIYQEEIFGPVVSVVKIRDLDDVLELIRAQNFGNGACIFTQNLYYVERFINRADVGMVGVNVGIPAPHPYLPFGGIKDSHLGTNKVQGKEGIDFFVQNKIATIRFAPPAGRFDYGAAGGGSGREEGDKSVRSCVAR